MMKVFFCSFNDDASRRASQKYYSSIVVATDVETARIMVSQHFSDIVDNTSDDWDVVEIDTITPKVINMDFI